MKLSELTFKINVVSLQKQYERRSYKHSNKQSNKKKNIY